MSDLVARGAANPQTIREIQEQGAVAHEPWYEGRLCALCNTSWPCDDRRRYEAALRLLDNAVLANSSVLPEAYRLVPDPIAPRGDAE